MKIANEELTELISACGNGEHAAFESLYRKLAPSLNAYAYRFVKCEYLSNEVLQDSFTQIWSQASRFNAERSKPITWMYMIVRSRALDKLRAEKKHVANDELPLCETNLQPETIAILEESKTALHASVAQLPQNMAICVDAAYIKDCSREELAQSLNANVNTVKSWLHRGLKTLQKQVDEEQLSAYY